MGSVGGANSPGSSGRAVAAAKAEAPTKAGAAATAEEAKAEKANSAEARKSSQTKGRFKDTFEAPRSNPLGNLLGHVFDADAAVRDFRRNANDLVKSNVIHADGYFHCKANFEATSRGVTGAAVAVALSVAREVYQEASDPKNTVKDSLADMAANAHGVAAALTAEISGQHTTAKEACADLRPNGLPDKY